MLLAAFMHKAQLVFFYRRQYAQVTLDSSGVVITDVALNHLHEFLFVGETLAVIAFPFQNAPESFHRSIVNAVSHTGHTLSHSSLYEFMVEGSACVLKPLSPWNGGWASGFALTALSKVL